MHLEQYKHLEIKTKGGFRIEGGGGKSFFLNLLSEIASTFNLILYVHKYQFFHINQLY